MTQQPKSYRDLIVWQKGIALAKEIHNITKLFPKHEMFTLVDQMRRAAISIPSNIAEGQARKSPKEFKRFLYIAQGSLAELDTQIIIAKEFEYISEQKASEIETAIIALRIQTYALINSISYLRQKLTTGKIPCLRKLPSLCSEKALKKLPSSIGSKMKATKWKNMMVS